MGDFLIWYICLTFIGMVNLPLSRRIFRFLPSQGFYLARPLGLLLWGFGFWLLCSLRLLANDLAGQITVLMALGALNIWLLYQSGWQEFKVWVQNQWQVILAAEAVFLLAFAAWTLVRSANPEILFTEKYMEMAFINAILKAPGFPPPDPWLSGYSIAYYYFGYVIIAMLTRMTGSLPEVAYTLVSSAWFGLTALGAYGLLVDLLNGNPKLNPIHNLASKRAWILRFALLAPLLLLIVSNWHSALDTLHQRGFWRDPALGGQGAQVWQSLKIRELDAQRGPNSWYFGQRNWPWWPASRTVSDFLPNDPTPLENIDEFPQFTFLLSDLHPHLLVLPFSMLAIGMALNSFWSPAVGTGIAFLKNLRGNWAYLLTAGILIGGIGFMNTWDMPFYMLLLGFSMVYSFYGTWRAPGLLHSLIQAGIALGLVAILSYLPFYLSFSSGAKGILPSMTFFTHTRYLWAMFGPLLLILLLGFAYSSKRAWSRTNIRRALGGLGITLLGLLVLMLALAGAAALVPGLRQAALNALGVADLASLLGLVFTLRLKDPGTLITLSGLAVLALVSFLGSDSTAGEQTGAKKAPSSQPFAAMLTLIGCLLVFLPEFIYLSDPFQRRMNTIFKFYIQAWVFFSLASAYLLARLFRPETRMRLEDRLLPALAGLAALIVILLGLPVIPEWFARFNTNLGPFGSSPLDFLVPLIFIILIVWMIIKLSRKERRRAMAVLALVGIALGMVFPVSMIWNKTSGFSPIHGLSLDGTASQRRSDPDLFAAIDWLKNQPYGVIAEAARDDYSVYNPVSTFTGFPAVLGWPGHEDQWRGSAELSSLRKADLNALYASADWEKAEAILAKYGVDYLILGSLERQTYAVAAEKFQENMRLVFEQGQMQIFTREDSFGR